MDFPGECRRIKAGMFSLPLAINQQYFDKDVASTFIRQHEVYLEENADRPHRFAIRNFLAVFHFRLGNIFKACDYFKKTLNEDESNVNALTDLVYVYQKLYQHTEAENLLRKLKSLVDLPDNATGEERNLYLKRQSRCIAETGYMYAYDISKDTISTGKQQQACKMYSQAIAIANGTDVVDVKELEDWKFCRGLLYKNMYNTHMDFNTGNFETVKRFYKMATDDFKANMAADNIHRQADACSNLGSLMAKFCSRGICRHDVNIKINKRGLKEEKCNCQKIINNLFKKALRIDPGNVRTYVRYGRELTYSHEFESALLAFNQAIVLDDSSSNWFAYSSRALAYIEKYKCNQGKDRGYLFLAEADLLRSIKGNPSPIDLGKLARVYYLLGSSNAGERKDQDNAQCYSEAKEKYLLKALHYFMNATEILDGNQRSDIHFDRGQCLLYMNEKRGAVESFKKALECEQPNCKTLKNVESLIFALFDLYWEEKDSRKEILAELTFWWRQGFENKPVDGFVNKKKNSKKMLVSLLELLEELFKYQMSDLDQSVKQSLINILSKNEHKRKYVESLLSKYSQDNSEDVRRPLEENDGRNIDERTIDELNNVDGDLRPVADVTSANVSVAATSSPQIATSAVVNDYATNSGVKYSMHTVGTTNSAAVGAAGGYSSTTSDTEYGTAGNSVANNAVVDCAKPSDTVASATVDYDTGSSNAAATIGDATVANPRPTSDNIGNSSEATVTTSSIYDDYNVETCTDDDAIDTSNHKKRSLKRLGSCTMLTIEGDRICMSPVTDYPSLQFSSQEQRICSITDVVLYICKQLDVQNVRYTGSTVPHPPPTSKSRFDYDFFVVFSRKQKEWVYYSLLARLEQTYKFKGCIPDRDFILGKTVCDNIKESVEKSACTMVVIDKEFCEDNELRHKLTYAYYVNARLKKFLIPIIKEHPQDIPMEICNLTPLNATTTINLSKLARDIEVASLEDRRLSPNSSVVLEKSEI